MTMGQLFRRLRDRPLGREKRGYGDGQSPDGRGAPERRRGSHGGRVFVAFTLLLVVVTVLWVVLIKPPATGRVSIPYNPTFLGQVRAGNVAQISAQGTTIRGTFRQPVAYPSGSLASPASAFATEVPEFANNGQLSQLLLAEGVTITADPASSDSLIVVLLLSFGSMLLFGAVFALLTRRVSSTAKEPLGEFTRSRARRATRSDVRATFDDVAGIDEVKAELHEVVDFLRSPRRYTRLGGRVPRGVLLTGPPGTGKTLLARAVAGEARAAFFSVSGSEFVEMIVGVGAARVRDLFRQAQVAAPAIIFIDELDAIGRSRAQSLSFGGANEEREQTLNQILTEMDGFQPNASVVVLSATNRPEILDQALLRPGRFDRRVPVHSPDKRGRRKILEVHTRDIPLGADVDLDHLAATTPGMVGADLANLANEAALTAARSRHDQVWHSDFTEALEKIILGAPRGVVLSPDDRRRTAYHEAGHALVGMLTPCADPVRKVSITPRGAALGVTLATPDADRLNYLQEELAARIRVALGGRVAEEIVYGSISTGAQSDLQQLTNIARHMVGSWGMSEALGPVSVLADEANGPLLPGTAPFSEHTHKLVDEEVRRLVENAHREVTQLLTTERARLDRLAEALVQEETLDQDQAYAAAGVTPMRLSAGQRGGGYPLRSVG